MCSIQTYQVRLGRTVVHTLLLIHNLVGYSGKAESVYSSSNYFERVCPRQTGNGVDLYSPPPKHSLFEQFFCTIRHYTTLNIRKYHFMSNLPEMVRLQL